jgi:hypothetical protein
MPRFTPSRFSLLACLIGLVGLVGPYGHVVSAQQVPVVDQHIYSCKDDQGRTITSDRPISECNRRDIRLLRNDGITKTVLPAPLTEVQRQQRDIEEEQRQIKLNQQKEQQTRDRALMAAYPNLDAIEVARQRRLRELQVEIQLARERILVKYPDLKAIQTEIEFYKGKQTPALLKGRLQVAATSILVEDDLIKSKMQEMQVINAKYDADTARLKQLIDPSTGKLAQATKH